MPEIVEPLNDRASGPGLDPAVARSGRGSTRLTACVESLTESMQEEWERLADDLAAPCFLRPGWVDAWAKAFCRRPVRVLCVRRQGEVVGLLPFVDRLRVRRSPTNWHTPMFSFLVRDHEARTALADALIGHARTSVDLSFLDRGDPSLQACLQASRASRTQALVWTLVRSPWVDLSGGDWNSFCSALAPKVRKELRRLRRRLDEQGTVGVEFSDGSDELEALLREGFSAEGSGWKERRGTAITSDPRTERFYTEIAGWAASRGELVLAFLRLDGRPIAFDLCIESRGGVYPLKGGFDPAFRRYGPGMLLTYESLRRAFARGLATYELLGDSDPYKLVWTQTVRERVRFQAFDVGSPAGAVGWLTGALYSLAWTHGRPVLHSIRATVAQRRPAGRRR